MERMRVTNDNIEAVAAKILEFKGSTYDRYNSNTCVLCLSREDEKENMDSLFENVRKTKLFSNIQINDGMKIGVDCEDVKLYIKIGSSPTHFKNIIIPMDTLLLFDDNGDFYAIHDNGVIKYKKVNIN